MIGPTSDELEEFFFANLAGGTLQIQRCNETGKAQWYPRCHSLYGNKGVSWSQASGAGTLFSFSVMHRGQAPETANLDPPTILGLVELSEGPLLTARIEAMDASTLEVGMKMRLSPHADLMAPVFTAVEV